MQKVTTNPTRCSLIADRLRPLHFRENHFNRPILAFPAARETKLRAYLFLSAICHQTHSLINKKKNLKGWSYLEDVFADLGKENSPIINPEFLSKLTPAELSEKMKPLFSDDGDPANCTLDRLEERADFMIQISKILISKYGGQAENLVDRSEGSPADLCSRLAEFPAFADPLKKKSLLFIQLSAGAGLLKIEKPDEIEPVIDYHIQRVLLRTGCLEVNDAALRSALQNREKLDSDEAVRIAAVEAVRQLGRLTEKTYFELDEILWALGRSCCHETTLCADKTCAKNPCTFSSFMEIPDHRACTLDGACAGSLDSVYRKFWQPVVDTFYY